MKLRLLLLLFLNSVFAFSQITFSNLTSSLITNTSATLSVTLANVCAGATYQLQYSTSAAFGAGTVDSPYSTSGTNGLKNLPINGLTANTTYYFRFYATVNQACNTVQIVSTTASFTTTSSIIAFSNLTSSAITNTTANVAVTVANACAGSTYQLVYSTSSSFDVGTVTTSNSTSGIDGVKNHSLSGLTPNTTYYYRFYSPTNQACNAIFIQSYTASFTTTNAAASITFSNLTSSLITNTSATVSVTLANVCAGATYQLQYSTSAAFGAGTVDTNYSTSGTNGVKNHNLTGLTPNATYYFRFYAAANQACNATQVVSLSSNFTTINTSTPTFTQVAAQCSGATFTLPTTSTNGISGTWSPVINNTATTTYTFTPTAGQGASTTTMSVAIITNPNVTPNFPGFQPICSGGSFTLPTTSPNGVTGTWSPAFNNMVTTTYTFVANPGQCSINATRIVTVNPSTTTTFTQIPPICSGGDLSLPSYSNENISGTWSPAVNNTATTTYTFTPTSGQCATTAAMTVTIITNPNVTPNFPGFQPICAGSSFTLPTTSPNGVTGTWSPAFNNMATTTYTFVPNPGQCSINATRIVTVNSGTLTPNFAAVSPICSGATLSALPTTSTNGITGTWSPALNNTATTTYTFTPTAGQCATTQTLIITVNAGALTPNFTAVSPICSGATLSALPTTSTNGITGTWSPALNNTATTTYTFTPTAGQCATTQTLTITVNSGTVTPNFAAVSAICSGATLAALPTTSTNGITGTWSPALNNTATTTYTFTPASGQCATTRTLTITVNSAATPTGSSIQNFNVGATIANLVVSSPTVTWYSTQSNALSNTNPLQLTQLLINGNTYYAVSVSGNCSSAPFPVNVTVTLGLNKNAIRVMNIYPNPVKDVMNIESANEIKSVVIFNLQGQKVLSTNVNKVNVSGISSGVYLVQIQDKNNLVETKKITKQ